MHLCIFSRNKDRLLRPACLSPCQILYRQDCSPTLSGFESNSVRTAVLTIQDFSCCKMVGYK